MEVIIILFFAAIGLGAYVCDRVWPQSRKRKTDTAKPAANIHELKNAELARKDPDQCETEFQRKAG